MKVAILAGGAGTRLAEETQIRPKPMVEIGGSPILLHIMRHYSHFGFNKFIVCLGYKGDIIKEYFRDYVVRTSDVIVNLATGEEDIRPAKAENWHISLVETGERSLTGLRVYNVREYLKDYPVFALTYGDGVSNIPLDEALEFHQSHDRTGTVSAVHPPSRFGLLQLSSAGMVEAFREKEPLLNDYINGGFFFFDQDFLETLDSSNVMLEAEPLTRLADEGRLCAYRHSGFWQCMDTLRDREYLESLYQSGDAPWVY